MYRLEVHDTGQTLTRAAAEHVVRIAEGAVTRSGRFTIALAGGSTPKALYTLLGSPEYLPVIDWGRSHVFWGDERTVPPEHQDSNYHMAKLALLSFTSLPVDHIHRMRGEIDPQKAADEYEQKLRKFFVGRGQVEDDNDHLYPRFDLVLLGMGDDGHTASLFPNSAALGETERWVVANEVEKLKTWRITLTARAINAAAHVIFLVTGAQKAERLQEVLEGESKPEELPAQMIQPLHGDLLWLVDRAAAAKLTRK